MNLHEIITAMQQLDPNQLQQLKSYMDEIESHEPVPETATLDVEAVQRAVAKMHEGLTEADIDEITQAMNQEYIEPVSEDEWKL